jgi:hypothetical protein
MATETPHDDADQPEPSAPTPPPEAASPKAAGRAGLRRRRRELLNRRQEVVYHLGGLAFELFRRDLLNEPVMRVRAEEVAELDRSVRDIDERLLELAERPPRAARGAGAVATGECPSCGSPHIAEASYCWNCGARLQQAEEPDPAEQPTGVVEVGEEPTAVVAPDREERA